MININYLNYYIPNNFVPINQIIEGYNDSDLPNQFDSKEDLIYFLERIANLSGIYVDNTIDEFKLIDKLFTNLDDNIKNSLLDIDLIIDFNSRDFFELKNCGHYIKHKYNLQKADVINISGNLCANLDIALAYCSKFHYFKNKILFCGGTKFQIQKRIEGAFDIVGDSYGLIITDFDNKNIELIDFEIITVGDLYEEDRSENQVFIFSKMYVTCLNNILSRHNISRIKKILIPNGFSLLIKQSLKQIGFEDELIYSKKTNKGHFAYLDSLINLKDFTSENPDFQDELLVISISYSGTIIASIYKKTYETD
jgi:hypothetical protein